MSNTASNRTFTGHSKDRRVSASVVIIGAGPIGLMLALQLSLLNVPFRIINALSGLKSQSGALTIHPRTLELLVRHGLSEYLATVGLPLEVMRLFVSQRLCSEASLPGDYISDS
ncbi:hypothetical protein K3495_g2990 [Podosphaera aphanis]|nr:hypothetical protein K3495_g2990 [Podosphaera aphanis]